VGPRNCVLDGFRFPQEGTLLRGWRRDFPTCRQAPFPVALTLGFPRMLLTSVQIGWPQKQSSVALNFPYEKSPLMWWSVSSKYFDHLFIILLLLVIDLLLVVYQSLNLQFISRWIIAAYCILLNKRNMTVSTYAPYGSRGCKLVGKCLSKSASDKFMNCRNKNRPSPFPGQML